VKPKLNRKRAQFVLSRIDEILAWDQRTDAERDTRFVELGRYLCEVRAGQYWRLEKLSSFDDFLTRRFPESRRKAYYLMSIHENLPPQARKELKNVGWTKGLELAKLARAEGQRFDCATWMHKAREMPKEEFRREVEKELTGRYTEPHEIIYFKLYKSQIPVVEQAIETARRMASDPLDWVYQSWAYDAHDVGTTPGFAGDTAAALRSIKAPTLLLVPNLDLYNPVDDAIEAARLIPDATLVRLSGRAGHAVAADASPQLAEIRNAISDFLTRCAGQA